VLREDHGESVPERLLQRLDDLGAVLERRGDALALIGLGSVGVDLERLDDHSDLDFFVIVEDGAKQRYLDSIDWLEELAPVDFSFPNSVDGGRCSSRTVCSGSTPCSPSASCARCRIRRAAWLWRRDGAPDGLEHARRMPKPPKHEDAEFQVNEALTNLYVGLHRDARGERLNGARLIQYWAVNRLLWFLELTEPGGRQDAFVLERGVEKRFGPEVLPLASMIPGYERNREAALAILEWLEARADVDPTLAAEIRRLAV
jgi:hypothetical protein